MKLLPQPLWIRADLPHEVEFFFVVRTLHPQLDISVHRILVLHVFLESLPLLLSRILRIIAEPKLYGTAEHCVRVHVAVSLCHNLPVDASGRRDICVANLLRRGLAALP